MILKCFKCGSPSEDLPDNQIIMHRDGPHLWSGTIIFRATLNTSTRYECRRCTPPPVIKSQPIKTNAIRRLLRKPLPKGWKNCGLCLFLHEAFMKNPGHALHKVKGSLRDSAPGFRSGEVEAREFAGHRYTSRKELMEELALSGVQVTSFQYHTERAPERRKEAPEWVLDDAKLVKLARRLQSTGNAERAIVAKNIACLYLYYRAGLTAPEIGDYMGMDQHQVEDWIARRIEMGNRFFEMLEKKSRIRHATYGDMKEPASKASA